MRRSWLIWVLVLCIALCVPAGGLAWGVYEYHDAFEPVTVFGEAGTTEYHAVDAVFLQGSGYLLVAGNKYPDTNESPASFVVLVDPETGDTLWTQIITNTIKGLAAWGDGYILGVDDGEGDCWLMYHDEDGQNEKNIPVDGSIAALAQAPAGGVAACGEIEGKPWIILIDGAGEEAWTYVREDLSPGAAYTCMTSSTFGLVVGGEDPGGRTDVMDSFHWDYGLEYTAAKNNAGSFVRVDGISQPDETSVIVSGMAPGEYGKICATSAINTRDLGVLAGNGTSPEGTRYRSMVALQAAEHTMDEALTASAGYTVIDGMDGQSQVAFALTHGFDGGPLHVWYVPFGEKAEAVKVLVGEGGDIWVIGFGDGLVPGGRETDEGMRTFIVKLEYPDASARKLHSQLEMLY